MLKSYTHLQHLQPAEAVVQIARYFGFYNVKACDGENIEYEAHTCVVTFGTIWLDATCGDEDGGLALTDMQVCEHINGKYENAAAGFWDLKNDIKELGYFMNLFYR